MKSKLPIIKRILLLYLLLLWLPGLSLYAQRAQVSGVVKDEKGELLIGVSIKVKGTATGTVTDLNGAYRITVDSPATAVLEYSYVGYATTEQKVGARQVIPVVLKEDSKALEEVVVIGYGTIKSREKSSAISQVVLGEVSEKGFATAGQMLQGTASGIIVNQADGQPGATLNMEIRGVNSISGSSQPLIVIDDIPMGNDPAVMNMLNPSDIASLSVLKDASATAIYGSRGSNGVVLITTQSAKAGETRINADYSFGTSKVDFGMDLLNATEFALFFNESRRNIGSWPSYQTAQLQNMVHHEHADEILQLGMTHNANVNVSGGDQKTRFFASGQYYSQKGIIKKTNMNRYTFKINVDRQLYKNLNLGVQVLYSSTQQDGNVTSGINGAVAQTLLAPPTVPLMNPDGSYNYNIGADAYAYGTDYKYNDPLTQSGWYYNKYWYPTFVNQNRLGTTRSSYYYNPLAQLMENTNKNKNNYLLASATMKYRIMHGLQATGKFSVTQTGIENNRYTPTTLYSGSTTYRGTAITRNSAGSSVLSELSLNYVNDFGPHSLNAILLMNNQSMRNSWKEVTARNFFQNQTQNDNLGAGIGYTSAASAYDATQISSFMARGIYGYAERYSLTFSARADGTSKFRPGRRWGIFPALSAIWQVRKEKFMSSLTFLDALDLRAGWGIVGGQSAVANYSTMQLLYSGATSFGSDVTGSYVPYELLAWNQGTGGLANSELTWEKTKQVNLGIDFGFFKNRLNLSVDLYNKVTSDLLMLADVAASTGYSKMWKNVAELENRGIEITLSGKIIQTKDFKWDVSINASSNKNKVLKLNEGDNNYIEVGGSPGIGTTSGALFRLVPGRSIGEFWGFRSLGMYDANTVKDKPSTFQPTAIEGTYRYEDVDGDGYLTDKDAVVIGSNLPKIAGGVQSNLSWKFLTLSASFAYSLGNDVYSSYLTDFTNMTGSKNLLRWAYTDSYKYLSPYMTPEEWNTTLASNARAKTPPPGINGNLMQSDFYVADASFLRLREVTLACQLPNRWVKKAKMTKARIFFTCNNAFVWTRYEGFNPEIGGSGMQRGIDNGTYPMARTYIVGASFGF